MSSFFALIGGNWGYSVAGNGATFKVFAMEIEGKAGPAYLAIADTLRSRIEAGEWKPGQRIPSERELITEFGVARMTLRNALDVLQSEALIDRRRGRNGGTFINGIPPTVELTRIEGFLPQLRERHDTVDSEILTAEEIPVSDTVAKALEIEVGDAVFNIVRRRSVDGVPVLYENSYFPATLFPQLLERDLSQSLYELLDEYGRRPVWKSEKIIPARATAREKNQLSVAHNLPLLRIVRVAKDSTDEVVEYSEDLLRSDATQIQVVTDVRQGTR